MKFGKEKYANGSPLDISKLSETEIPIAIKQWSEGNPQLEKLLLFCNQKNIETIASCAGHSKKQTEEATNAYILFKLGQSHDDFIINLLAKLEESNTNVLIGFTRNNDKTVTNPFLCGIHAQTTGYNESLFEQINKSCIDLEKGYTVNPELKTKYESLKTITTDRRLQTANFRNGNVLKNKFANGKNSWNFF